MNSYWENTGNHEELNKALSNSIPSIGMTSNAYVNLYITSVKVYYDVYNNGGTNLDVLYKHIEEFIKPFDSDLKSLRFNVKERTLTNNLKNLEKLERFMDEVILYLQDKDMEYDKKVVYVNFNTGHLSNAPQKGFDETSFGSQESYDDWVGYRLSSMGYAFI